MSEARVAIIGGSGLYRMEGLEDVREVRPTTPFGDPSDAIVLGRVGEYRRLSSLATGGGIAWVRPRCRPGPTSTR